MDVMMEFGLRRTRWSVLLALVVLAATAVTLIRLSAAESQPNDFGSPFALRADGSQVELPRSFLPVDVNEKDEIAGIADTGAALFRSGRLIDLGTLGHTSYPNALNEAGLVVGVSYSESGQNQQAFLWDTGQLIDLTPEGAIAAEAADINDSGVIVGWARSEPSVTASRAVLWRERKPSYLEGLTPDDPTTARKVNNSGQVLGVSGSSVVLWNNGGKPLDLGDGSPIDLNDRGEVVLHRGGPDTRPHPGYFLWKEGVATPLAVPSGVEISMGGLNNEGTLAGFIRGEGVGLIRDGTFEKFDLPPQSQINAINDHGTVVGLSQD